MRRTPVILLLVLAALVATGCGEYGKRYTGADADRPTNASDETPITDKPFDAAARKAAGCTEIKEFESEGSTHTEDKVTYENNPPHSGDHNPVPAEWGLYDKPQPENKTTHNLEHGHIVVSYKGLSDADEKELYELARINPYHLLVQPRDKNPKKGVYYTAWTAQLYCERPSAPALQYMIDEWRDQGPELYTDDPGGMDVGSNL